MVAYKSIIVHWQQNYLHFSLYDTQQKTMLQDGAFTLCISHPLKCINEAVRGEGSSLRNSHCGDCGADLNNPHFSGSPGGFQAHLPTAGVRLCCPFIWTLTMTETWTDGAPVHTLSEYNIPFQTCLLTFSLTFSLLVSWSFTSEFKHKKTVL